MKRTRAIAWFVAAASLLAGLAAADAPFTPAAGTAGDWSFTANPALPNVLILGDSISIGYTRAVRAKLAGKANVYRPMNGQAPANCGDTRIGLEKIDSWLGARTWHVIHFNWGLWDLCYRNPQAKTQGKRDKAGGTLSVPLEDYERNLERLVARLRATGARLIWASTTVVPEGEAGRFAGDELRYNAAAARVMARHGIPIDDLHAVSARFAGKFSTAADDVHFTPQGYDLLATEVAAQLERRLAAAR